MNTVRSVWMGWGTLMFAGATAYYFAKKDINAHRREQELKGLRGTEYLEWWQRIDQDDGKKKVTEPDKKPEDPSNSENTRPKKKRTHGDKLG